MNKMFTNSVIFLSWKMLIWRKKEEIRKVQFNDYRKIGVFIAGRGLIAISFCSMFKSSNTLLPLQYGQTHCYLASIFPFGQLNMKWHIRSTWDFIILCLGEFIRIYSRHLSLTKSKETPPIPYICKKNNKQTYTYSNGRYSYTILSLTSSTNFHSFSFWWAKNWQR